MTEVATQGFSWISNGLRHAVAGLAARDPNRDGWWSALAQRLAIDTSDAYYRTVFQRALDAGRHLTLDPAAFDSHTILLACGSLGPGGTERQVVTTARALSEHRGRQVKIVCMFLNPPPLDFYRPLLDESSVSVSELPLIGPSGEAAPYRDERALGNLASGLPRELRDVVRYVDLFRASRPSVVHAWLDEINVKAGIAALIAGVPRIVLSARSVAPTHFRLFQPYMAPAYRLLLGHPRVTLLNNSAAGASDYAQWLKWPASAIRVVRNGIDMSAARRVQIDPARHRLRDRLGIAPDCLVVGTVIRLSEEKRPLLWVESAAALARSHPSCHFVVVGDGDLASSARTLAETLGIAPRCHFLGHQPGALEWIGGFDVFLLTSRKEGLPNVLLEAQALGVPVVSTDAGGAAEALIPGRTGWIVEPADADHIAAALRRVLDQPQWRAAVRRDGPEFVASQFGLDPMIAETLDVYGRSAFMTHQGDRLTDSLIPELESADRFEFGRNWKRFIRDHLSQDQIEHSKRHLLDFLGLPDLGGRSFLDIGCGSGLHSLAAHQSGAHDIFGFDYDPHSVDATLVCRRFAGDPRNWRVVQGSILDEAFVGSLSLADIVYSWGVLHHTGDVWRGIRNAASRVRDGGVFYLALYSADVQKDPPPEFWLDVKRRYNRATWLGKRRMDLWYIWRFAMGQDVRKLPVILARVIGFGGDRRGRGMSFFTDVRDWLGGWPMEFVYDREVIQFCEGCGLVLDKIRTGEANTEFLFRRPPASQAAPPPGTPV